VFGGFFMRGHFKLKRFLAGTAVIAAGWCFILLAQGYHFGTNAQDQACGAHGIKVDFVIPMYRTNDPCQPAGSGIDQFTPTP